MQDAADGGVRLACDSAQEASALVDYEPHLAAQEVYNQIAARTPVHFIFGREQSETCVRPQALLLISC
jgi:hypothetical protein